MVEFRDVDGTIECYVNNGIAKIGYYHQEEDHNPNYFFNGTGYMTAEELRQIANKLEELNA